MRRVRTATTSIATLVAFVCVAAAPRLSRAGVPSCTTTTTTVTTCTGPYAPLAAQPPAAPPPQDAAPPQTPALPPGPCHCPPCAAPPTSMLPITPGLAPLELKYREERRLGLAIPGFSMFATSWLLSILVSTFDKDTAPMAIPVVGPILFAAEEGEEAAPVIFASLVQTAGLLMGIIGAASKRRVAHWEPVKLSFAPTMLPGGGGGFAIGATF